MSAVAVASRRAHEHHELIVNRPPRPTKRLLGVVALLVATGCGESEADAPPTSRFRDVAVHDDGVRTCGISDDAQIRCWGRLDEFGEVFEDIEGDWVDIAVGDRFDCVRASGGDVRCWGETDDYTSAMSNWRTLAVSPYVPPVVCGVLADGVECRFSRKFFEFVAQYSDATTEAFYRGWLPRFEIEAPKSGSFKKVDINLREACALSTAGELVCWALHSDILTPLDRDVDQLADFAMGSTFACGIRPDGTGTCWGHGPSFDGGDYVAVSARGRAVCFTRREDRHLDCIGADWAPGFVPEQSFRKVSVGPTACGVLETSEVVCWGNNEHGQADVP